MIEFLRRLVPYHIKKNFTNYLTRNYIWYANYQNMYVNEKTNEFQNSIW